MSYFLMERFFQKIEQNGYLNQGNLTISQRGVFQSRFFYLEMPYIK